MTSKHKRAKVACAAGLVGASMLFGGVASAQPNRDPDEAAKFRASRVQVAMDCGEDGLGYGLGSTTGVYGCLVGFGDGSSVLIHCQSSGWCTEDWEPN